MASELSVELIAHSSILVRSSQSAVLCDPWYLGRAFNDGWALDPEPELELIDFAAVTHLWISHEHPDHFSIPTLRFLAERLSPDVRVLFQDTNSTKLPEALRKFGFKHIDLLPHLQPYTVDPELSVVCYQHRHLDSALGFLHNGSAAIFNVNDCELTENDCSIIKDSFGEFPVIFNQFSIAGFEGNKAELPTAGEEPLENLVNQHRWLGGRTTVPFASFVYFCMEDNAFLNEHRNTALDAMERLQSVGLSCHLLRPQSGPRTLTEVITSGGDVAFYKEFYDSDDLAIDSVSEGRSLEECREAFARRVAAWSEKTSPLVLRRIKPVRAYISDLEQVVEMNFQSGSLNEVRDTEPVDMTINSQPLHYAFDTPFGIQTLGVSGRYSFTSSIPASWKLVRVISSLANAGVYLGFRGITDKATLQWAWSRRKGLGSQLAQQVKRFTGA